MVSQGASPQQVFQPVQLLYVPHFEDPTLHQQLLSF